MVEIDLSKDAVDLRAMLVKAVATYAQRHKRRRATARLPVTRIGINFWLGDGGSSAPFALLQFDTRPDAGVDGIWSFSRVATFDRPRWRKPIVAVFDGEPLPIKLLNGQRKRITRKTLVKTFGDFYVEVMKTARASGLWDRLPISPDCRMDVEDSSGEFGWPKSSLQGRVNLASVKAKPKRRPASKAAVKAVVAELESILKNRALAQSDVAWHAIARVGRFAKLQPEAVWEVTDRCARHPVAAVRRAAAPHLLRPLLATHFELIFPRVRRAALANARFAKTYHATWMDGQAHRTANIKRQARLSTDLARLKDRRSGST